MNAIPQLCFTLLFDDCVVGSVEEAFESDGTWYGRFTLKGVKSANPKVINYINECQSWNEAVKEGEEVTDLVTRFPDVIGSGKWRVERNGEWQAIEDAPVFFSGGDISWLVAVSNLEQSPRGMTPVDE